MSEYVPWWVASDAAHPVNRKDEVAPEPTVEPEPAAVEPEPAAGADPVPVAD